MPTLQYDPKTRLTSAPSRSTDWLLGGFLVAVPVIVFAVVWNYYAVNVPKWDDHALRAFLYYFDQETTFSGKIYQFFRQHNEHRIVYDRIVAFLDFHLSGKLNFRHLMAVGNLSLVGLLVVFIGSLHRSNRPVIYAVPVALLLFNLSHWENMFWGMAALQNFSVVLWVMVALYWLTHGDHWKLAIASAILATLTSGSGLLVWPIGFVLVLLRINEPQPSHQQGNNRKQSFLPLFIWIISAVLVLTLYFMGYEKPVGNPPLRGSLTDLLKGWFSFIGAAAEALPTKSPLRASTMLGGAMALITLGIMAWELVKHRLAIGRLFQRLIRPGTSDANLRMAIPAMSLFFWGCAAFILGTAAVVAWTRTGFGIDLLITSRYKIYSLTLLVLLYVYIAGTVGKRIGKWALAGGLTGSFLFAWFSYLSFLDDAIWFRHWQITNQFNWTYTTNRPVVTLDSTTQHYTDSAPAFYEASLPALYGPARQVTIPVTVIKNPHGYFIQTNNSPELNLLTKQTLAPDAGVYILARSPKRSYLFPVWQNQRSMLQARFLPTNLFTEGFKADIWESALEAGTYQVFVLNVSANNDGTVYPTNQHITSAGQPADIKKNW